MKSLSLEKQQNVSLQKQEDNMIAFNEQRKNTTLKFGFVWFVWVYDMSTITGYLTPNPFSCKLYVVFKTIQFSTSTQFNCQKHFYLKIFKQLHVTIQLSANTVLM